jgi:hypothetical protein
MISDSVLYTSDIFLFQEKKDKVDSFPLIFIAYNILRT